MYQLIAVNGPDAESFLQGQLTQDVGRVSPDRASPAASCTPKGRVLTTVLICRRADGFDLVVPADIADDVVQRLLMYKLRAHLELRLREDVAAVAVTIGDLHGRLADVVPMPAADTYAVARIDDALAVRIDHRIVMIFAGQSILDTIGTAQILDNESWAATSIRAGQVVVGAANSGKYTPHMLSLDLAGAVSFDKGCYTGQEVVARTEHLGKSRRRLMRYTTEVATAASGDPLLFDGETVGTVVNAAQGELLAVTPQAMHGYTLQLAGGEARPAPLPWS